MMNKDAFSICCFSLLFSTQQTKLCHTHPFSLNDIIPHLLSLSLSLSPQTTQINKKDAHMHIRTHTMATRANNYGPIYQRARCPRPIRVSLSAFCDSLVGRLHRSHISPTNKSSSAPCFSLRARVNDKQTMRAAIS